MKPTLLRTFALVAALLPAIVFAAKDGKRPQKSAAHPDGAAAEVLKTFDKNENHQIDADELPALQKAFVTLKNLDKNNNHEIELTEVESLKPQVSDDRRGRLLASLKQVDKNGNHKIDADEVEIDALAPGRYAVVVYVDRNGNGKLDRGMFGRPTEPYGFSNGGGSFGPPDFADALIEVADTGSAIRIDLN